MPVFLPALRVYMLLAAVICFVVLAVPGGLFAPAHKSQASPTIASVAAPDLVPCGIGTTWLFTLQKSEQIVGVDEVESTSTTISDTVVDSIKGKGAYAVCVEERDLKTDQPPTCRIELVYENKRLYELCEDIKKSDWSKIKSDFASGEITREPDQDKLQIKVPCKPGTSWNNVSEVPRDDGWYAWTVEKAEPVPSGYRIANYCLPAAATEYTVAFRTCPDHQIVTFVPGIGVIDTEYVHHGTVDESHRHLIDFRLPNKTARAL